MCVRFFCMESREEEREREREKTRGYIFYFILYFYKILHKFQRFPHWGKGMKEEEAG
jgi:hypothetical protein